MLAMNSAGDAEGVCTRLNVLSLEKCFKFKPLYWKYRLLYTEGTLEIRSCGPTS